MPPNGFPPTAAELAWCSRRLGCAAESTKGIGAGEGLLGAGAGDRAGPWKGMLFVGEEESPSAA